MKERPILFSGEMVRAILDGRKTQTRRVVKPQPSYDFGWYPGVGNDGKSLHYANESHWRKGAAVDWCPYGQPGDRLWGREAWAQAHPLAVQPGRYSQPGQAGIPGPPNVQYRTIYRADGEPLQVWRNADQSHPYFTLDGPCDDIAAKFPTVSSNYTRGGKAIHWSPSIHMPRWASRITLEITGARVERLQDISENDAQAEGYPGTEIDGKHIPWSGLGWFMAVWQCINGVASWDANPWVWAIEFKRL